MSSKKTTPEALYLKDLRKSSKFNSIDIVTASKLFKKLNSGERERYVILSRKINETVTAQNVGIYTTQRDTIGSNLKDVADCKRRNEKWHDDASNIIKKISEIDKVIEKQFVVVQVSGVYFSRPNETQDFYTIGDITFVKFNFQNGVTDSLVLFPECLKISIGYRESLYEAFEESVGWRPDTFKNDTLEECSKRIRDFFSGIYDPIYAISNEQMQEAGAGLFFLYNEIGQRCPWIHSLIDWGQHCTIYRFDDLVANILNKKNPSNNMNEAITSAYVREHWLKMNKNMASQCCKRHQEHGLPNQCSHDIIIKNLYGTFLLLHPIYKDEMLDIRDIVSREFFNNLDLVLEPEPLPSTSSNSSFKPNSTTTTKLNDHWLGYVFDHQSSIEDILNCLDAISLTERSQNVRQHELSQPAVVSYGRGRGGIKKGASSVVVPGVAAACRKIKLPNVVC